MDYESKNGVIQSSIALLQKRFKQLQKEKEMRQKKELLKSTVLIMSSSSSSSSSDSESESYNYACHHVVAASTTVNNRFSLLFPDEVAVRQPQPQLSLPPQHLVALSLWPAGDVDVDDNASTSFKNLRGEKDGRLSCGDSHVFNDDDGVDTSLHL